MAVQNGCVRDDHGAHQARQLGIAGKCAIHFSIMRDDIDKEHRFMPKAWAERDAQVSTMIESTVGMVGDLYGIVRQAMPKIAVYDDPPMLEWKAA
jgi:hypothetical protein